MEETLLAFGILAAFVWAGTEGIGRLLRMRKDRVALVLGIVCGPVALAGGLLDLPEPSVPFGDYVLAVVFGLLATAAAGVANDYVAKAVSRKP